MASSKEKSKANHAATITGDNAGSVFEDGTSAVSGVLLVSDVDKGENQVKAIKAKSGEYGKFSINTDGTWTYVLNNKSNDVQALASGETITETFVVTSKDGSASKTVEITITGANDVATIKGDTRATLTEDSCHTTAHGRLEVKDRDHDESSVQTVTHQAGTYGSFSIDAKGRWTYEMDNSLAATQALAQGEKGTDSFVVWSQDGSASQTVVVTLKGVNDIATITGQDTGSVDEDAAPNTATGQLIVNDVDSGENTVVPIAAQAGAYGSFSIAADGSWTYTLDNSLLAVQSLAAGVTLTETFVVYSSDSQLFLNEHDDDEDHDHDDHDDRDGDRDHDDEHGGDKDHDDDDHDEDGHDDHHAPTYKGASKVVTVTIVGTNDAAVISGSSTGAVTEDLSLGVSGQLFSSDIDTGEIGFQAQSATAGVFGSYAIDADGVWSYTLNNGADNVQALAAGEVATDTFVVKSFDGTEQQVTVTITGTNDLASISGTSVGAVTEDLALSVAGALTVVDVDHGEAVFQAQAGVAATYGSFDIGADGNWTYALNATAANVQALAAGEQVTDSFTVVSFDGTASQLVMVTITGTNDGPVITNNAAAAAGTVTEDNTLSVMGQLSASDVDHGATQAWSIQGSAAGAYGTIGLDAASGQWTYTLNNEAANVQALAAGQSQTETLTVRVTDDQGATADQQVSVTVMGANDGPVLSQDDATGSVTAVAQAGTAPVSTPIEFTVQQYLGHQSNSLTDLRSYAASHTADYTVQTNVIDYTDDPAGFAGELPGSSRWPAAQATGASQTYDAVNNTFFARITADFSVGTADTYTFRTFNDDGVFLLIDNNLVISDTGYHPEYAFTGSIALTPGNHTIELFFFENGGEASLEFSARTSTGSYGLVGSSGGGFSGGASQVTDTGLISFTDVDLTDVHVVSAAGTPMGDALGALTAAKTMDTTGSGTGGEIKWIYTAPNSALLYLAEGQTKVESFTITLDDQHGGVVTKQIDVTLTGSNDVASISGVATAQVAEDSITSVGGTLTVADPDQGEAQVQAVSSQLGNYGSFSVDNNGNWHYDWPLSSDGKGGPDGKGGATPEQAQAYLARQALADGEVGTDSFTVTSLDGTATQNVVVTVVGANDAASIYGAANGEVTEDLMLGTAGTLYVQDVDHDQAQMQAAALSGNFGNFMMDASGNWTYDLAPTPVADGKGGPSMAYSNLQALAAGQTVSETFAVASLDGTATQDVTISVAGSNDGPVVTNAAAAATGAVTEDGTLSVTGQLSASDVDNGATQAWSVQGDSAGAYGAIGIDTATGLWTYTLNNTAAHVQALAAGENHVETFTVRVTDDQGATADQQVSVTVSGSNDGPLIAAQTGAVETLNFESGTYSDGSYAHVSDGYGGFSWSTSGTTYNGIAADILANGEPGAVSGANSAWNGYASKFSYISLQDAGTFNFEGANFHNYSSANQIKLNGYNDGVLQGSELINLASPWQFVSSNLNGIDQLVIEVTVGTASGNGVSNTGWWGMDDFKYSLNSGSAQGAAVKEDATLTAAGQLAATDVDHGATQTWSVEGGTHGVYGVIGIDAATGQWTYSLNNGDANVQSLAAGETQTETFTLRVTDDQGATADQSVSVVVTGANDGPAGSATAALAAGTEDTAYTVSAAELLAGFSDMDNGAVLSLSGLVASDGTFVDNGNGTYTITPTANFNGAVTLNYTVVDALGGSVAATQSYNVAAVNDAPVAQNDANTLSVTSLASQTHSTTVNWVDWTSSSMVGSTGTVNGTINLGGGQTIGVTYTGEFAFAQTNGGANYYSGPAGTYTSSAVANGPTGSDIIALSLATQKTLSFSQPVDNLFFAVVSLNGNGYLFDQNFQILSYGQGYWGTGSASKVALADGRFKVVGSGELHGVLGIEGSVQSLTWNSESNEYWNGFTVGTYGKATTATASGHLLSNDSDVDVGDVLSVSHLNGQNIAGNSITQTLSSGAQVKVNKDGTYLYDENNAFGSLAAGQTFTDSFGYTVSDGMGGSSNATVNVTVTGINDGPTGAATAALAAGTEDAAYTISATDLLAGFSDVDAGDVLSVSGLAASNGTVADNGSGTYTVTPTANFNGAVTLNYSVVDGQGGSVAGAQNYSVSAVNDAPTGVANATLPAGAEDTAYTVDAADLLAGFSDVDAGDVLSVSGLAASNGTLVNNGNGTYTVTPTANFNGAVTLNYTVVDGMGGSVAATQSYDVAAVNDAPVMQGTLTDQLYTSSLSVWTPFLQNNGVWVTPDGASSGDSAPHTFVRQFTAAQDGNYVFQFAVDNEGSVLVDGVAIPGLYNNDWSHSTVQTVALTAGIHTVTMNALNWGGPAAFAMNITDPNNHEIWNTRTHLDPEPLILSYTENQAAMVVSAGLTLTDIDSPTMTHAAVSVATGFAAGEDVLGFVNQNGITGTYDANTGVLSLGGSATQAQYQAALRSVTYSNSSDSPSTADRTINFAVDDGAGQFNLSNTVQSKIVVLGVNDAATISGTSSGTVTEDTTLNTSGTLTVSDADAGEAVFVAQSAAAGTYGTFSIDAAGEWTYTLDNAAADVQALNTGSSLTDSFSASSLDGTASQLVTVAINGLDDNQAPVAVNDTISGAVLTFEYGTYSYSGVTITTGDYSFSGNNMYVTSYYGADNSYSLYSYGSSNYGYYGYGGSASTTPITMTQTGGGTFKLESVNVTTYNYGYAQTATETVTGYLNGVQVASQSFAVPNISNGASHNNTLTLSDAGFAAVDQVVFNLSGATNYYLYQWLDNISIPSTVAQARDVNVLINDTDVDAGAHLTVANFSGFSAHGAAISLNANGTLHYDPTVSAELQAVSQGTNVYDTFTYQSQDEFGVLSNTATVEVTLVGIA